MKKSVRWLIVAAMALAPVVATAASSSDHLGDINFPNSGAAAAQDAFLRGVGALHNFWFEEAGVSFKNAQEIDPSFALAYWGEAMSYNHPLWAEQDIAAAREVLKRLGATRKERIDKAGTEREKMYMEAIETLYGDGDKLDRDIAYSKAMERIYDRYPDDREGAAFYALSILGTVRPGDKGFYRQVKAGTIALDLFEKYPNHPGAAHYVIHSFDDPEHAPLALKAANRYADIAPESSHALHMPSHIFVQHGMWDRVAQSNLKAFDASVAWVERSNLSIAKEDFHALEWRAYANLQRGVWGEVKDAIQTVADAAQKTDAARLYWYETIMSARYIMETGKGADRPLPEGVSDNGRGYNANGEMLLALGLHAAWNGDVAKSSEAAKRLAALADAQDNAYRANNYRIMQHEVQGAVAMAQGKTDEALSQLKTASELEETQDPPSGPASPIKPSHELYGEMLAKAGQHEKAMEQFRIALQRTPNRTDSLLGLARSASAIGDMETASQSYQTLQRFLKDADSDVPFLSEVRGFQAVTEN